MQKKWLFQSINSVIERKVNSSNDFGKGWPYNMHRFFTSVNFSLQDVLNFMTTKGFHYTVYTLSSSYPRRLYNESGEMSLQEADITKDTMLNIEHID